jgi:hypothetical protein
MTIAKPSDWPDGEPEPDLDLGDDHWASFTSAGGEGMTRSSDGSPVPYVERAGLIVWHRCTKSVSGWNAGAIVFDLPERPAADGQGWTVQSWDPLTVSPSLLQPGCGDHGFIRGGKWQRA